MRALLAAGASLLALGTAAAQELEPRSYSPAPVGTTILLNGVGRSQGAVILDPSTGVENVQLDLTILTTGVGYTFGMGGRQARILAVFPAATGEIEGDVAGARRQQSLWGLVDPRIKLSVGLRGLPALSPAEFASAPRRTIVGVSVTVTPPLGDYDSDRLVNLGYNRWGLKPEVGVSRTLGKWTLEGYAGVWMFTTNHDSYPGGVRKKQSPVASLQTHVSYALPGRLWIALDGTWFSGGRSTVDGVVGEDLQRNSRLGATLSIPASRRQSVKLSASTGTSTFRGSDLDAVNATWQVVWF